MRTALVLVVDDCEDSRELFASYLRYAGFNVEVASNGREAVDLALSQVPSVILMDINMPVMDGWEAIRQLRANDRTIRIPVIAVSAQLAIEAEAQTAGCHSVVPKPCPPQQLVTCVLQALSATRRRSSDGVA